MVTQNKTQREIKFRAWDKERKIMYSTFLGKSGDEDNDWILFFPEYKISGKEGGKRVFGGIDNPYPRQQFELMQYTGLHDKQGKEIYEGDIVKACWGQGELIAEIMFEDGAFVLGIRDDCYRDMAGEDNNKSYEVIGNIYEHSYLLDTKL